MNSYSDVDGVPAAADHWLLTDLLREEWGFAGTVVSDYWAVPFLATMHRVAADTDEAGAQALAAGIDVELPDTHRLRSRPRRAGTAGRAAGGPRRPRRPAAAHAEGAARAARRGLDAGGLGGRCGRRRPRLARQPRPRPGDGRAVGRPARRRVRAAVARRRAPGAAPGGRRRALRRRPAHVHGLLRLPQPRAAAPPGSRARARGADRGRRPARRSCRMPSSSTSRAATVQGEDRSGFAAALAAARAADLCVAVVGDLAGLFGHGTSGEGCDAEDLRLPGVQADLLDELLQTGTPVVVVVVSGRPYALGDVHGRAAGLVQAFMPGEEGGVGDRRRPVRPDPAEREAARADPAGAPAGSPAPTSSRRSAVRRAPASAPRRRPRCSRSATARSYTTFEVDALQDQRRRGAHRRRVHRLGAGPQHRARGRATRWSSSTCTTSSPRSPAR